MSKSIQKKSSLWSFILLIFLSFISTPAIVLFLILFIVPLAKYDAISYYTLCFWIVLIISFMLSSWIWFIPKRNIEIFRKSNFNYEIPPQIGYYPLVPICAGLTLIAVPIFGPFFAVKVAYVIIFQTNDFLPIISELDFKSAFSSLKEIIDFPDTVAILIWMFIAPYFTPKIWRMFRRQIGAFGKPALCLTGKGLYLQQFDKFIPWGIVAGVEVTDFTSIRLVGGEQLDRLRPVIPGFAPKSMNEAIGEHGFTVSVAGLPVSATALAHVIAKFAKLK